MPASRSGAASIRPARWRPRRRSPPAVWPPTRALVVTVIACLAGILVSPLTTLDPRESIVWLLPALALSAISVAIATLRGLDAADGRRSGSRWLVAVVRVARRGAARVARAVGRRTRHRSTSRAGGAAGGDRRRDRGVLRPPRRRSELEDAAMNQLPPVRGRRAHQALPFRRRRRPPQLHVSSVA